MYLTDTVSAGSVGRLLSLSASLSFYASPCSYRAVTMVMAYYGHPARQPCCCENTDTGGRVPTAGQTDGDSANAPVHEHSLK